METGDFSEWPTVPGWAWSEECGAPGGEVVPFVRLAYTRGVEAVELALPRVGSLLLSWWAAIADDLQAADKPSWVPAWVWLEHGDHEALTCVSLDRVDEVPPRELLMPTSARGRMAVRKAVIQALLQITGEDTAASAVAVLEEGNNDQGADQQDLEVPDDSVAAEQLPLGGPDPQDGRARDRPADAEPEILPRRNADDVQAEPTELVQPQEDDDGWPNLLVWIWLELDGDGEWQAHARLGPAEDVAPLPVPAPVSHRKLSQLWFMVSRALRELETGRSRTRSMPIWMSVEVQEDQPHAWVSFERLHGVGSTLLALPDDEVSLAALRDGIGAAMVWLTDCATPDAAARELAKPPRNAPETRKSTSKQARRKPKRSTTKRSGTASARSGRRMVIPRIRIVSGGAPGLGKRR